MIFERNYEVRYSELGEKSGSFYHGHAGLPAMLSYWQDSSMAQTAMLANDGRWGRVNAECAWFLISWQAEFYRYPSFGEKVSSRTWATGFKGVYGYRDFALYAEDGAKLAAAATVWALMDPATGKLKRCSQEVIDSYGAHPERSFDSPPDWKMRVGDERRRIAEYPVRLSDIDTNAHVNNVSYIRMALDATAREGDVRRLAVNYKKAAVLSDTIYVDTDENGVVVLSGGDGDMFAAVSF